MYILQDLMAQQMSWAAPQKPWAHMETNLYSSQAGLNSEEVRSQILVSTLMTQALLRLQGQTSWVNRDVRERADRKENVGVERETSKLLCAAFLLCDPKTDASISCASASSLSEASRRITAMDTRESRVISSAASFSTDSLLRGAN